MQFYRKVTAQIIMDALTLSNKKQNHDFVRGWLACALLAKWITLKERTSAELALIGQPSDEWWKICLYQG